jgi:hypothetical protein
MLRTPPAGPDPRARSKPDGMPPGAGRLTIGAGPAGLLSTAETVGTGRLGTVAECAPVLAAGIGAATITTGAAAGGLVVEGGGGGVSFVAGEVGGESLVGGGVGGGLVAWRIRTAGAGP